MTSALSTVPPARRRRAAATLGLFAMLFLAVAAVAITGGPDAAVRVFAIVALVTAVLLGLIAWGLFHSVRLDAAASGLDAAIEQALAESGGLSCDCGHDHDMSAMHVQGGSASAGDATGSGAAGYAAAGHGAAGYDAAGCAHDGSGADCTHDCDTCALAALRPSPTTPREERISW